MTSTICPGYSLFQNCDNNNNNNNRISIASYGRNFRDVALVYYLWFFLFYQPLFQNHSKSGGDLVQWESLEQMFLRVEALTDAQPTELKH